MRTKPTPRTSRFPASQALLFAPVALLAAFGLLLVRNGCSRPIIAAHDSPEGNREAFIHLEYPWSYPFSGDVLAVLEVRWLPGKTTILRRELGRHRWAGTIGDEYGSVSWDGNDAITLGSREGDRSVSVRLDIEGGGSP